MAHEFLNPINCTKFLKIVLQVQCFKHLDREGRAVSRLKSVCYGFTVIYVELGTKLALYKSQVSSGSKN